MLERRELKSFKTEIRALRADDKFGRKCRRNFLRYCDDDGDKRITLDEWIECTDINGTTDSNSNSNSNSNSSNNDDDDDDDDNNNNNNARPLSTYGSSVRAEE